MAASPFMAPLTGGSTLALAGGRMPTGALGDSRGLNALRNTAAEDPKAAIKGVAQQFEALFMQELMKSMRAATPTSGLMDNAGSQMGTEMLDTQFATQMSGQRGGLGEMIARQLERQMGGGGAPQIAPLAAFAPARAANAASAGDERSAAERIGAAAGSTAARQAEFVDLHTDAAKAAEASTGIPASFMVAQAAHESGWGRREIKNADGSTSHNLFGIKAGSSWKGPVAEITTTEYINGEPRKVTAKFRAYSSYEESFQDYAKLMKDSPRYSQVVANASSAEGFAKGLQRAGYATDPAYADKLTRVINTTLRLQRVLA